MYIEIIWMDLCALLFCCYMNCTAAYLFAYSLRLSSKNGQFRSIFPARLGAFTLAFPSLSEKITNNF